MLYGLGAGGGVVTGEMRAPGRLDTTRGLIARVEAAEATWRAQAHEREAASEGLAQAARYAVVADAQALRRIGARLGAGALSSTALSTGRVPGGS
ncbi:hypothetical protein GCM10010326_01180 [Streptomyces xanthochromogenes]|uniref:Uncharacterized protein n=1 Tax=Streptomyces xanthochromogenes TaxID=67384 RepID=A0ABQ2ZGU1_9ACTN|nr:hypothetical protein GCM10010326_01180 [Streptomyces xanthochromogenes]